MKAKHPHRQKADLSQFYVITVVSNPARYERRYELYWHFKEMCDAAGVKLITVEQAFGEREFMITNQCDPFHLQVVSEDELWHKENMINLGIEQVLRIDPRAKYIGWCDADISPMMNPRHWFEETWHELQHYQFVQMFERAQDLDYDHNPVGKLHNGFVSTYHKSGFKLPDANGIWKLDYYYEQHGHPGYAWAANVSALNHVGRLIDFAILGSADRHMAMGLVGCMDQSRSDDMSPNYKYILRQWEDRANRYIKRDIGFVRGAIFHYFHGHKKNRNYSNRWRILIENGFDPLSDLKKDAQGLLQLETHEPRQIKLRDQIRAYFRARNEDERS